MPNPVSSYLRQDEGLSYQTAGVIEQRPSLAIKAMTVIEIWSYVDARILQLLSLFLKLDVRVAIAMLLNGIEATAVRRKAVLAAAEHVLSTDDYNLLLLTLKTLRASESRRHHFAHHIWAVSDKFPNDLLLIDPKYLQRQVAAQADRVGARTLELEAKLGNVEMPEMATHIQIFTEKDLEADVKDAIRARDIIGKLTIALRNDLPGCAQVRAELLEEPLIAQAFRNQQK